MSTPWVNCLHRYRSQTKRLTPKRRKSTDSTVAMETDDSGGQQDDTAAETAPTPPRIGRLTRRSALRGMGAVAGIAAVNVGGFAYAGGWLRPNALTPPRFADRFEHVYGRHDGFRRNHAKGLSATGSFAS